MPDTPRYEPDALSRRALIAGIAVLVATLLISTITALVLLRVWWPGARVGAANHVSTPLAAIMNPVAPSAARFDALFWAMTGVCGLIAALVLAAMIGLVLRFHHSRARGDAEPIRRTTALELSWTLLTFAVFCGLFWFGARGYRELDPLASDDAQLDDAIEVLVTAERWLWSFETLDGPRELGQLHVPAGRAIRLHLSSRDVIHSFFVPAFRLKRDVVPGLASTIWFRAELPGRYPVLCAEYCGRDHSRMRGEIVVSSPADYEAWAHSRAHEAWVADAGAALFRRHGCHGCHVDDGFGERRGPALAGVYGRRERLADGREVTVDEAYLRESILVPGAALVAGWPPNMPPYAGQLSDAELTRLVLYLRALEHDDPARERQ